MNDRTEGDTRQVSQEGYFIPASALPQHSDLSFADILTALRQHRLVIIVITLVCLSGASVLALLSRPVYRAEVVVVPVQAQQTTGGMLSLVGQFPGFAGLAGLSGEDSEIQEAIAILRSRKFTSEFIQDNNLLPILFASDWDSESGQWAVPPDEQPTLWDAYTVFHREIRSISDESATGIVTIAIEWHDPVVAATWANALVDRLNSRMRDRAVEEAERSLEYLREQLDTTSLVELREGLARLIETQLNKVMLANSRQEYLFRTIDPADPPDPDDYIKPNRAVLILSGGFGGFFLGVLVALILSSHKRPRAVAS
jgi:uncharacterized protein involved in exopolysaccharide biosynthesis